MTEKTYQYVIVGSGLAGASAIEGIREIDKEGTIMLIGDDINLPYDRPPLSKELWFGKKTLQEIFLHDKKFYEDNKVDLALGEKVTELNASAKFVQTGNGEKIYFSKLLLATGGIPRRLDIPGGNMPEIIYYRTVDDYKNVLSQAVDGKEAIVIGGGFIGSEIAAALNTNKVDVTMIFPENYLIQRIFPEDMGHSIQRDYLERGIHIIAEDVPVALEKDSGKIVMKTKNGLETSTDFVIAGIGIIPAVDLAKKAGLKVENGITVNERLETSMPGIYSAGDNTYFQSIALNQWIRIEHWDNSIAQGKHAGKNMAGADNRFDYIPFFFSDLFEFGYEAVGTIDSGLDTVTDWKNKYSTGVVYYLKKGKIQGVMLCNVHDKLDTARELIRKQRIFNKKQLRGLIPLE